MSMIIARHFGHPRGVLGRLVGRMMARFNADFNRWVVEQVKENRQGDVSRFVDLGPGPGVGLEAALKAFPAAQVWGVDPSPAMLAQSRRRNQKDVVSGRLALLAGDVASLGGLAPIDVVMANHVLYFWHQPAAELARLHAALGGGGTLALGYQLRHNMPKQAQANFPREGHILYDTEDAVTGLLRDAGFTSITTLMMGTSDAPEGRLAIARA